MAIHFPTCLFKRSPGRQLPKALAPLGAAQQRDSTGGDADCPERVSGVAGIGHRFDGAILAF